LSSDDDDDDDDDDDVLMKNGDGWLLQLDHQSITTTYTSHSKGLLHNTVQLLLPGCHRPSLTLHRSFTSGYIAGPLGLLSAILYSSSS